MKLLMYGISEETVAKDEFECYRLTPEEKQEQINEFLSFSGVQEVFIFTTCQRMEYYLYVDETSFSHGEFLRYLADYTSKPLDEIILETTSKFNEDVIRHLYELMGGFLENSANDFEIYHWIKMFFNESKDFENRHMLKELFQRALSFAIESKTIIQLRPLMHNMIPRAITLLSEYFETIDNLSLFFIGNAQQLLEVYTLLEQAPIHSLTLVTSAADIEILENELDVSKESIKISTLELSGYQLAESDVVFILDELGENVMSREKVSELLTVRQTPKKQYIVDEKETLLGQSLQEKEGAKKIIVRSFEDFSFEEKEEARQYLDEMLDLAVDHLMNKYLTE